jgi:hypothetical protein
MASASESAHSPGGFTWKSMVLARLSASCRKGSGTARSSLRMAEATDLPEFLSNGRSAASRAAPSRSESGGGEVR